MPRDDSKAREGGKRTRVCLKEVREAASWEYCVFGWYYNGGPETSNISLKGDA